MKHSSRPCGTARKFRPSASARHPLSAAIAAAFVTAAGSAGAELPTGAAVVSGTAGIASNGTAMTVTNSPNAIINWKNFSIGARNGVRFDQQNAASQVLNRVVGNDPSSILGSLSSNGGVWLVNPHGVLFGANARIDVGGLVASTLGISNEDFLGGRFRFEGTTPLGGQVLNQGAINTTFGGRVWLMGDSVRNEGLIQTPGGNIVLAAGRSIELVDSGIPNVTVRVTAPENEALNLGSLIASGNGSIDIHGGIVNQQGIVRADSVGTDAAGHVVIKAQGDVKLGDASTTSASNTGAGAAGTVLVESATGTSLVSGQAAATSSSAKGGQIHVLGKNVGVIEQATLDASGASGGGAILVGGDYLGSNPQVPNADASFVGQGTTLRANATTAGDGGRIIVWSNDATRVYGSIEARGASAGGLGGFVETSGGYLDARPRKVDVGSGSGKGGTWLLDPNNITITDIDYESPQTQNITAGPNFTSTNDNSVVSTSTINTAVDAGGTVRVITASAGTNSQPGNITVAGNISKSTASSATLELLAQGDITINPGVSITGRTLDVTLASNIASFDSDAGVIRFPPADANGGIIVRGAIGARDVRLESGGKTPGGNGIEFDNAASIRGRFVELDGATWTSATSFSPNTNVSFGTSSISASDKLTVLAGSTNGAPTLDAGGSILFFGHEVHGGTWTSAAEGVAIVLAADAVTGVTLNTPAGRWVVVAPNGRPQDYQLQPSYIRVNQPVPLISNAPLALGPESGIGNNGFVFGAPLNVNVRVNASRPYDGTRVAVVSAGQVAPAIAGWPALAANFIPEGPVTGSFIDKNVGVDKSVTLPGTPFSLAYNTVPVRGASLQYSADITPKFITAAGITADNKVYDATRTATLRGSLTGIIPGDDATLNGAAGLFDTKNVGIGKTVTIGGGSLAGADAGNYAFTPGSATTTADITPRPISTSGITAQDKVYDGNRVAAVSGSLSGAIAGDSVTLSGATGLFDTKNVGAGKAVSISGASLAGADAGNYVLSGPATTTAAITPKPVDISLGGAVSKEYDATTGASLASTQYALNGLVPSDLVSVKGPTQGSYDSPNVGTLKRVTATGAFEVTGADAPNYSIGGVALTNATSTVSTSVGGNVGAITPATLTYNADPAVRDFGAPLAGFTGNVSGFKGADSVGTATSGSPNWQTPATVASLPGTYAINGSGLSAGNYVFTQAPANASALTLRPNNLPDAPQQKATQSSTAAIDAALGSVIAALNTRATIGGVFDISSPSAQKSFEAVDIASMSQDELAAMLEARRNFKRKLFADAIYKLEIDPSLADVRPCADAADVGSGLCRVTPAQIDEAQAKREKAQPAPKSVKTRNSSLPQIERKIAVLFGIDDYADTKIPRLENSIPDVEAVSKLFSEKLGYEIRVVRNPTKADIIRTLNQLSTEINSSDSVVIYYAGHGYSLEKNGAGYWLPSDASVSDPAGWISNSDVAKLLAGIRSRQMAVISDSCYSGAFAREGMGSVGRGVTADEVLTKRSVVVLSSGGDEPVADEGKEGHSIFAWNLMKAVNTVENWRPGSTIFTEVQVGVKKEFPQTPKYGSVTSAGHQQGGDYLFELR